MDSINQKVADLEKMGNKIPQLVELSKKSGVRVGHICLAIAVLVPLFVLIFFGVAIITTGITVIYPAFMSVRALESKDDEEDDKQWLSYWLIFGVLTLADQFLWFILEWIPYYFWIRFALFVFLFAPGTQGALKIYNAILKPALSKNKEKIQKFIDEVKGGAASIAKEGVANLKEAAADPSNMMKAAQAASAA